MLASGFPQSQKVEFWLLVDETITVACAIRSFHVSDVVRLAALFDCDCRVCF